MCFVLAVSLSFSLVSGQLAGAATQDAQAFDQGMRAFREGDYPTALEAFLAARRAGLDTQGLRYNLGVTYYRLGRHAEAEHEFQALTRDPRWAPVANYNRGLTAQRQGRDGRALEHFEEAHRTTTDPSLRTLAATALERLGSAPRSLRTGALVSLAGGYDSDVTLSQDAATVGASRQSDLFAEALAATDHRLAGDAARGWYAHGGLVLRKHRDLDRFDLTGLRAGLSHEADSGRTQTGVGGYLDTVYIGGDRFEQAAGVDVQARGRLDSGGELRGRYRLEHIAAGAGLEYLGGWQQRLSGDFGFAPAPVHVRIGYQLELNNRRDFQQGSEFSSYSPTRNSLFSTVVLPTLDGWRTEVRGEYRVSRYADPYRLSGGALEVTRRDDRYGGAARASRRLRAPWRLFIDYSYYRNKSTLNIYDYDRHQLMAGVEAALEK